ncbi:LLM class flavin-dependent oxidoreductase [Nocardioides ferulae]|uniref:LLM class flavin-dependent oxidoreductase n=1 Tax=Nocardioides ferulae TaxID=2340821 RepID=UPI001980E936|nr:LLM class flavin-dependent oxidoreductase [Nocardioides ferulae]
MSRSDSPAGQPVSSPQLGVVFRPQSPPEDLRAVMAAVDAAGVDELWLWEDCFLQGGLTTAAAALALSERVHVGVGLLPVPLRNPALAAMEIANLARLWPGRLTVTLGHGVQEWMAQVGAAVESPLTLLREHTTAVRDLLSGQEVTMEGRYVRLDRVRLDWPPQTPPRLLIGARGPRSVGLAGELTDGVLLDSVADADAVRRAHAELALGRDRGGRALDPRSAVCVYTEVDPMRTAAELNAAVAERVRELGGAGADSVIFQATGQHPSPVPLLEALATT